MHYKILGFPVVFSNFLSVGFPFPYTHLPSLPVEASLETQLRGTYFSSLLLSSLFSFILSVCIFTSFLNCDADFVVSIEYKCTIKMLHRIKCITVSKSDPLNDERVHFLKPHPVYSDAPKECAKHSNWFTDITHLIKSTHKHTHACIYT